MAMLINGELSDHIEASDRGLQYGDGVFETIAIKAGECEHWFAHMSRLSEGCQRLNIPAPNTQQLLVEAQQLLIGHEQAVLKIIITRGAGGRGYRVPESTSPTRILSVHPWPIYPSINTTLGIQLHLCETRLSIQPALAGIKHLNKLEQIIARGEWQDPEISEGLMMDQDGHIIEATMSNIFIVSNNELLTPKLSECGVAGIMRAHIIQQAGLCNITTNVCQLSIDDVANADELFVCNSIIGIWPVRQLQDKHYNVVGDVTSKIMNGLL